MPVKLYKLISDRKSSVMKSKNFVYWLNSMLSLIVANINVYTALLSP